ncbi:hypothetical protein [Methanocaldococcus sp.]|uniref:hypothetical protein n=1 Tax=Methanocaldococcus sp. TaxID=2152917 RepID=UPI00260CDA5E|nr:hypothetical protein [Methanocaldococcus sp.]MCQ6253660.1 hypothetical protein [Methanocaldococcus sp.]
MFQYGLDDTYLNENIRNKINEILKNANYDKNNPYAYKNRKTRAAFIKKYDKDSDNVHPDADAPLYYIEITCESCMELNEIKSMVDKILYDINSIISESEDNDLSSIELSLADYRKAIHVKYFYNVLAWKLIYTKISSDGYLDTPRENNWLEVWCEANYCTKDNKWHWYSSQRYKLMDYTSEEFGKEFDVSNGYPYYALIDKKSKEITGFKYFNGDDDYTYPPRYERKFGYTSITGWPIILWSDSIYQWMVK